MQSYTLARRIYQDLGLKRIALLRVNDRYGRFGVAKFQDASRRLGHPVAIEQKYLPGATDMTRQLRIIADSDADGIVIWGDQAPAAAILKQMRELGMKQPVFGSYRVLGDDLLQLAGDAAEGLEAVFPFDPTRDDPAWLAFQTRYQQRFQAKPEVFASLAYDTMSVLLQAIDRAGLNRGRIRDALAGTEHFKGVTGAMDFDPNSKNIVPLFLAKVRNHKFEFRRYPMQAPYATIGETKVPYNGPQLADAPAGPVELAVFGRGAEGLARSLAGIAKSYGDFRIVGIDSDTQWGKASDALVSQIYDGHALAILATDRNSSHLAEQLGVKALLPVLALSDDRTLTTTNVPWIFRLPASTDPADALRRLLDAAILAGPNRARLRAVLAAD